MGYPPGGARPEDSANHRNGTGGKTVLTDDVSPDFIGSVTDAVVAGVTATKLIWLALRNITAKWERGAPSWRQAMNAVRETLRGPLHQAGRVMRNRLTHEMELPGFCGHS